MADEEQSGFSFVDKRGVTPDPTDSPTSTKSDPELEMDTVHQESIPAEADNSADVAGHGSAHGEMPRLNVRDRLLMCIDILNQGAWISLGLISDPSTGQIEQDLAQAQIAIDGVAFLSEKVESQLDAETRRDLNNLVRDLRLNFVQQSGR